MQIFCKWTCSGALLARPTQFTATKQQFQDTELDAR